MKKIYFLLVVLISNGFILVGYSYAQKPVNEATISYNISIESVNDKPGVNKPLTGTNLVVYIKGTQSRADMVSTLGIESNLYDSKLGKGTVLKQYSGQKLMITLTKDNWEQKNQVNQNMKFIIDNSEKTIAGYKCKTATGESSDGKKIVIYFTTDIVLSNKQYENAFAQLPGLPVQYELQSGKLTFKYTLSNVNYEPVPSTKFDIPKSGFRIMSYEENQQLKKGEN